MVTISAFTSSLCLWLYLAFTCTFTRLFMGAFTLLADFPSAFDLHLLCLHFTFTFPLTFPFASPSLSLLFPFTLPLLCLSFPCWPINICLFFSFIFEWLARHKNELRSYSVSTSFFIATYQICNIAISKNL